MPATTYRATVEHIDVLSYNVRSFHFKLLEPRDMPFRAGQFVILNVPQDAATVVKRAYSITSPPHEPQRVELCIQHVEGGKASTYLWKLKPGDPVSLSGPHGNFSLKEPMDYDPVFIATGTGIAPLRAMLKHLIHINFTREIWLFFGCRYEHSLLYESEFRALANVRRNFHYMPTVSRPKDWRGEVGHVQESFRKHLGDAANKEIYLCGWLEIVRSICADLQSGGIPKEKLHYEEWA